MAPAGHWHRHEALGSTTLINHLLRWNAKQSADICSQRQLIWHFVSCRVVRSTPSLLHIKLLNFISGHSYVISWGNICIYLQDIGFFANIIHANNNVNRLYMTIVKIIVTRYMSTNHMRGLLTPLWLDLCRPIISKCCDVCVNLWQCSN